jgi:nitroreductase
MLIASHALGYHSQWLTEWMAYNPKVKAYLKIPESENIIGFLYIGTAPDPTKERPRPELSEIVSTLKL